MVMEEVCHAPMSVEKEGRGPGKVVAAKIVKKVAVSNSLVLSDLRDGLLSEIRDRI